MFSSNHSKISIQVETIGLEQQPLLVVDHFMPQAESLIDFALQQNNVLPAGGFYPGLRSPAPQQYSQILLSILGDAICNTFGLKLSDINNIESFYSLVSTPTRQLKEVQQIPHFDKPHMQELAVLHYLCHENHGGTSFYRHKQTQYEYIDDSRKHPYLNCLENEIIEGLLPRPPAYINGDTALFEQIESKNAVFNRALVYRCSSLHSGNIPSDYAFDLHPDTGRFTIASFLHK